MLEKAAEQEDLVALRREIIERYVEREHRVVAAQDPPRGRDRPRRGGVALAAGATLVRGAAARRAGRRRVGAFLVWGDPSLYDGMIDVLEDVRGRVAFEYEVIPGISAVSALAARHRIVLNRVGGAVQVTTGRRLAAGLPEDVDDVVVMLDSELAFTALDGRAATSTGARTSARRTRSSSSGPLAEVADEIVRVRAEARTRKGWMFDTYLLRRVRP